MFEDIWWNFFGSHHSHVDVLPTSFAYPKDLVPGLGLDAKEDAPPPQPTPSINTGGPIEYIFKIATTAGGKDANGIYTDTSAANSTPRIQLVGDAGQSELVPIKPGLHSSKLYEFSAIAKDVGPVKAIRLSDPDGHNSWKPEAVVVNRLPSFSGKDHPIVKPDGWVTFTVNQTVGVNPVTVAADTGRDNSESIINTA
jgi:hypothetical protein